MTVDKRNNTLHFLYYIQKFAGLFGKYFKLTLY